MSIDILKEDIKTKKIRSLYLFHGPEEYLKKHYTETIEKLLVSGDMRSLNYIVLEGKAELPQIIDNIETMPVFSDRKMVVVKNSGLFKPSKKAEGSKKTEGSKRMESPKKEKKTADDLQTLLHDIPSHTCLVFFESEVDKRLKVVDAVKKNGLMVEFAWQKPEELVKWVIKRFKAEGVEIDINLAAILIENCEQGMTEILNEVEKLLAFLEGRGKVTRSDIDKVCVKSIKSRIFDLTDAIASRDSHKALRMLADMLALKEPVPRIMFMIARQFRQTLQARLMHEEGATTAEIASKLGMMPFIAGKVLKQASGFTTDRLKMALEKCLEYDVAVKTGRIADITAVELLVIEFSQK